MQGGVGSKVDGTAGDTGVVVVDKQWVVSDLMACCPPPNNHLIGIDFPMQLVHVLGEVQLHCNLEERKSMNMAWKCEMTYIEWDV